MSPPALYLSALLFPSPGLQPKQRAVAVTGPALFELLDSNPIPCKVWKAAAAGKQGVAISVAAADKVNDRRGRQWNRDGSARAPLLSPAS